MQWICLKPIGLATCKGIQIRNPESGILEFFMEEFGIVELEFGIQGVESRIQDCLAFP